MMYKIIPLAEMKKNAPKNYIKLNKLYSENMKIVNCILLIWAVFSFLTVLYAQESEWLWAEQAGGLSWDSGNSIATDSNGNIYVTGMYTGNTSFGSTILEGDSEYDYNLFVAKLNNNGNWLWATNAETNSAFGRGVSVDNNGSCYIAGNFSDSISFGLTTLISNGSSDAFVAKLDPNGNWIWARSAGSSLNDHARSICTDDNGNCYIIGNFASTCDFGNTTLTAGDSLDIFVAKMDTNGNWLWAQRAGGIWGDNGNKISLDGEGNIFITGYFRNDADFGNTILTCSGFSDAYIAKLDTNGNWQWAVQAGGMDRDYGNGISTDVEGNCYVTGTFIGNAHFGHIEVISNILWDTYIAKIDCNGNWIWVRHCFGSSIAGYDICNDYYGNSDIIGVFYGSATFGNTTLISNSGSDIFVCRIDTDGNWQSAVQVVNSSSNCGYSIKSDISGNRYITGYFCGTAYFGTIVLQSSGYGGDIFVAKLTSDFEGAEEEYELEISELSYISNAYPNPLSTEGSTAIKAFVRKKETGSLKIYNIHGQCKASYPLNSGDNEIYINGSSLPSGIYLYQLKTQSIVATKKLVILN
jgi:hypothetical protein